MDLKGHPFIRLEFVNGRFNVPGYHRVDCAAEANAFDCDKVLGVRRNHEPAAPVARDDPRVFGTLATDVIATDGLPPTAVFQINQALVVINARAADDYSGAIAFFAVRIVTDKRHISLPATFVINGARRTCGTDPAVRAACEWVAVNDCIVDSCHVCPVIAMSGQPGRYARRPAALDAPERVSWLCR